MAKYHPLNLPEDILEELKLWKQAFSNAACRPVTYAEMFRSFMDNLEETDCDVVKEMDKMIAAHPEFEKILGGKKEGRLPD